MHKLIYALLALVSTSLIYAKTDCRNLNQEIFSLHQEVNAIEIPEFEYVVNEQNCSIAETVMSTSYDIETHLTTLLGKYEELYFECGKEVDVIYTIEDTKINIMMMQTLTTLAKNLHNQCNN